MRSMEAGQLLAAGKLFVGTRYLLTYLLNHSNYKLILLIRLILLISFSSWTLPDKDKAAIKIFIGKDFRSEATSAYGYAQCRSICRAACPHGETPH
jgi:hypothetical protein